MPKIATADRVDRGQLIDFVRPRHRVTLVTTRSDGRPQLSPVMQVDGSAEVLDMPDREAEDALVGYFRCISGEHPDWAEYREAMVAQGKSLLRISPVSWGPVATGGFPARLA